MQSALSYETNKTTRPWPWIMLFSRVLLFLGLQAIIAAGYWLTGSLAGWEDSAAWWPVTATLANVVCIGLLVQLKRREGQRYWSLFQFHRDSWVKDSLITLGLVVVSLPLAVIPNIVLAQWLFGNAEAVLTLFVRPLPLWAIVPALALFPITIAFAELPTYFGYVQPRLETQVGPWLAVLLSAGMLAAQHVALPFLFNTQFVLWRLLMFLPFALFLAIVLRWRPRLLPYLVVIHALLDLNAAWMVFAASSH